MALTVRIANGTALAEDWEYVRIGLPIVLGFYNNVCSSIEDADILRRNSIYYAEHPDEIDGVSDLSIQQCFGGSAEITPLSEVTELGTGRGWNAVFAPDSTAICIELVRIEGVAKRVEMPCRWQIQRSRFFWVKYMRADGELGKGIAEVFPTSITVQYFKHPNRKKAE